MLSECASEHQLYVLCSKIILNSFDRAEGSGAPLLKDQQLLLFFVNGRIFCVYESDSAAREEEPRWPHPHLGSHMVAWVKRGCVPRLLLFIPRQTISCFYECWQQRLQCRGADIEVISRHNILLSTYLVKATSLRTEEHAWDSYRLVAAHYASETRVLDVLLPCQTHAGLYRRGNTGFWEDTQAAPTIHCSTCSQTL